MSSDKFHVCVQHGLWDTQKCPKVSTVGPHIPRLHVHIHTLLQVEGKTLPEVTEFYYYWKKYCNDEYRGRNRHISEEVWYYGLHVPA